jgi:glutamyl-tRNA synthetase
MTFITRFAPSPTGFLHTGSARTALFNYLFSKHTQGKFLLRVEDTDKERSTEAATNAILADMKWLGLNWDGEIVFQSKNQNRHAEVAKQMLATGSAYNCYASQQEIETFRKANPNAKFQSPWRDKDAKDAPKDINPAIRLKAPRVGQTIVKDLILGEIKVENHELDDMVLLRSDGTPTYMLAVVVDDHDMNITHIIRGADHLTNAFRQKQIYEMMGWIIPEFAHIPLIMDKDGSKLSKRKGALAIDGYKQLGYLPEAVLNHLLRLGWGHGNDEIISVKQAIEWFDLGGVGQSPAKFDIDKLNHINAHYLRAMDNRELFALLNLQVSQAIADRIVLGMDGLKNRAHTLVELTESASIYIAKKEVLDQKSQDILASGGKELLAQLQPVLAGINDWSLHNLQEVMSAYAQTNAIKPALIMQSLRAGVLGTFASPAIYEVLAVLGKEETLRRLGS